VTTPAYCQAELRAFSRPIHITFWDWLGKYFVLSKEYSDVVGLYPRELVPVFKILADWVDSEAVKEIIVRKSTQIGLTTFIIAWHLYRQFKKPGPQIFAMADQATTEEMINTRFKSSIENAICFDSCKNIVTKKGIQFSTGGSIKAAWGSSVAALASTSARDYSADEITKPGWALKTQEGEPVGRLRYRAKSFDDRQGIITSTVTLEGDRMHQIEQDADCTYLVHVPCPHCDQRQPLFFFKGETYLAADSTTQPGGYVHFDSSLENKYERARSARYCCGTCGALWTTEEKNTAMQKCSAHPNKPVSIEGEKRFIWIWRIHEVRSAGSLYSLVLEFLESKDDPEKLQNFYNNALALYFKEIVKKPDESFIAKAKADYHAGTVPDDAIALIATVDVQKYGFWYVIRAWSNTETSWKVEHGFIQGEEQLNHVLFEKTWPSKHGPMRVWRVGIDTGGGMKDDGETSTEWVYRWYFQNLSRGVQIFLTKGFSGSLPDNFKFGKPIFTSPTGRRLPAGLRLVLIDAHKSKDLLFWRINQTQEETPICAAYIPSDEKPEYFQQLQSEHKVKEGTREVWTKKGNQDNHLLDCEQMQMIMASRQLYGGVFIIQEPVGIMQPAQPQAPVNNQEDDEDEGGRSRIRRWRR
jgi:terminase, large subunit